MPKDAKYRHANRFLTKYDPSNKLVEGETKRCIFCTRWVFFDSQHVGPTGVWYPHDQHWSKYKDPADVPHHGNHCPDLNGDQIAKAYYKKMREQKGMKDPYYKPLDDVKPELKAEPEPESKPVITVADKVAEFDRRITNIEQELNVLRSSFSSFLHDIMLVVSQNITDVERQKTKQQQNENETLDKWIGSTGNVPITTPSLFDNIGGPT